MEVGDVLTDDVNLLGCRCFQQSFEIDALGFAVCLQTGEVADRGIQPNVEEFARLIGDFNAEIRSVARDVPVAQISVLAQPFGCFCNDLRLKTRRAVGGSTACPLTQELYAVGIGQFEEKVFGLTQFKLASGECGVGIDQVGRTIDGSADFAGIAVLVRCAALGAGALDKAVGKEHLTNRVVILLDFFRVNQTGFFQALVDVLRELGILFTVGGMPVVEADKESVKVLGAAGRDFGDIFLGRDAFFLSRNHNRSTVGIVCTDKVNG